MPKPARRLRVLYMLPALAGGGAERTVATLLQHADRDAFDTRLGVLNPSGELASAVSAEHLLTPRLGQGLHSYSGVPSTRQLLALAVLAPLQQWEVLRRFRPDVVMSCTVSMNVAMSLSLRLLGRRRPRWIVREGTNTLARVHDELSGSWSRFIRRNAIRLAYRSADRVLAISNGVAQGLRNRLNMVPQRVHVVYNPVDLERVRRGAREGCDFRGPFLLAAGRLVRQKGFDVLLRAFARLRSQVSLVILGDGPEREDLLLLASQLGIADRVQLPGFTPNPWAWMARASAFVLSSRYEGFACVVVEAMASAAPVIVTDCDYGPKEIVRDGDNGLLVPTDDEEALAAAMDRVLEDEALNARLVAGGLARCRDFEAATVTRRYEDLFREVAASP